MMQEDMSKEELIKWIEYYFDQEWRFHMSELGDHIPKDDIDGWLIINSFSAIDGSLRGLIYTLKRKLGVPDGEILPQHEVWWHKYFPDLKKKES